jgi:hypothetical protein
VIAPVGLAGAEFARIAELFAPGWPMLAGGGGAQITYSAAVGR